jgi:hypothetical protein
VERVRLYGSFELTKQLVVPIEVCLKRFPIFPQDSPVSVPPLNDAEVASKRIAAVVAVERISGRTNPDLRPQFV